MLRERWPPWKAGLYGSEVVSPWECCFWTGELAYDKELASAPVEKRQKLDVPVVNYVFPESKVKPGQSGVNKTHNSGRLLRVLWKSDHLGLF